AELPQAPAAMLASLQPGGASPADDTAIRERIESTAGLAIAGEKLHGALLRQFYAAHNYQPVWPSHEAQANALLAAVMRAGEHGLDPGLFHAALLRTPAALSPLDRELLLSDAFLAYADALARGVLPVEIRMDDEDLRPEPVDVAAVLDSAIASPDPASAVEALAPHTAAYLALRQALQAYRTEAGTALPEPQPAAAHDGRRLAAEWTPAARVREIEINLERLRWLPRQMPPDRVRVNTATAELELYRADRPVTAMRVVVGQFDKQTPEFATTIDSILFHPPWLVPPSIARSEILPKLDRDPGYLARHHMIWRRNGGIEQLPPSALGRLKFEMADRFDVYLHDTPERFLFARADRRKSHGCVRVQHPRELAALLLQQPLAYVDHEIAITGTHSRPLPAAMPVYIVYQTAFLNSAGKIEFVPDVYQRDAEVWQHLHPMEQAPMAAHAPALERKG
ncbi:MAG TPA: L,D-transpeptidase family protein, partial [Stellaceae bacterium]|nr:L,D-transpeptidase family protein [Stellaceae bacterium]